MFREGINQFTIWEALLDRLFISFLVSECFEADWFVDFFAIANTPLLYSFLT